MTATAMVSVADVGEVAGATATVIQTAILIVIRIATPTGATGETTTASTSTAMGDATLALVGMIAATIAATTVATTAPIATAMDFAITEPRATPGAADCLT